MEDAPYRESAPLVPRNLTIVIAAVLAAAVACMALTYAFTDAAMPSWTIPVSALVFAVAIAFSWTARMDVTASDVGVTVRYVARTREYPRDEILDKRVGDLEDIRNLSNWNLKGVSHRSCTRVGEDGGVALKLKGRRVVVLSSSDPEALFARIPLEITEDDE